MASYYNPSRRLSDWAAAALSPFIQLETQDGQSSQSSCLSVALWSGQVQLKNVELRPEAFDQYLNPSQTEFNEFGTRIRWKIVQGTINDVSVSIPWKRLLVGTSYSSSRKRGRQNKHGVAVVEGQNEVNRSLLRLDSDAGPSTVEMGSCVDQGKFACDVTVKSLLNPNLTLKYLFDNYFNERGRTSTESACRRQQKYPRMHHNKN